MPKSYQYQTNCVDCGDGDAIHAMVDRAKDVTLNTFRRHCAGVEEWAERMGYRQGLTLKDDWHVSCHKSTFRGKPCYYIVHSAIEHIWVHGEKREPIRVGDHLHDGKHTWEVINTLPGGKVELFDRERTYFSMRYHRELSGWGRVPK